MKRLALLLVSLGLIFAGCDSDDNGDSPTSNLTSTAHTDGPYTVRFVTNSDTAAPGNQTVAKGGTVTAPAGSTTWYNGAQVWDFTNDKVIENMTLVAQSGSEFTSVAALTTFLESATPAGRHTTQGVDPNSTKNALAVKVSISLTRQNWADLVNGIEGKNKKVILDLSDCTAGTAAGYTWVSGATGTTNADGVTAQGGGLWQNGIFNPLDNNAGYLTATASRTNNTIVGLILPDAATKLQTAPTNLNLLKEIRGKNVTEIVTSPSFHGGLMAKLYFPALTTGFADAAMEAENMEVIIAPSVTSFQDNAFKWTWKAGAPGLYYADIRGATSIGNTAFSVSGTQPLTIVLGATPPTLGTSLFQGIGGTKRVTVKVPTASVSAYTDAWQQGLQGKGWSGGAAGNGTRMQNIQVTVEGY